jgi:HD superfamily phosphodiesterase
METYFGRDRKRIDHAHKVLGFAEKILENETAERDIVEAAAILHDIGIHAAEKRHGSTAGHYQEIEGPPIAENILGRINFPSSRIPEVLEIIANHHSPGKIDTKNFKVLYDADWLVNLADEYDISDKSKLANIIEKVFLTETGKKIAQEIYLNNHKGGN